MKLLLIGDLHHGEQGNSEKYNNQLLDFYEWCIETFGSTTDKVVQFGDYFHNRDSINVLTLNYGIAGAKMLGGHWGIDSSYVLGGNHDIYYSDRLDVSSLASIEPYMTVIDEFATICNGEILLAPWIATPEMWDQMIGIEGPSICFGHFELNGFKMNDAYVMESGYSAATLESKFELTLSGHYHSKQEKGSVKFIGTPLPITMNEANEEHGVYTYDTETKELVFHVYDKVKVLSIPYRELVDIIDTLDPENTTVRVEFPDDLEDETLLSTATDLLTEMKFSNSKIKYKGQKAKQLLAADVGNVVDVEDIDAVVLEFITGSMTVSGVDNDLMESLYRRAIKVGKENMSV